jgi:protein-tyrosine-phosphatase/predicted ATP-grasp superfamily ATP-dependent carboligase
MRDEAEVVGRAALHPAAALETALDKEKLRRLAAELGVPTPASAYVQRIEELDDARIAGWLAQGGVVVKATVSKAWNAGRAFEFPTKVAADAVELRRLVAARVAHVPVQVQEWVPGHGVGIEVLAHRGDIALHIAHERIHEVPLTGGGSSYRRTIAAPAGPYGDAALLSRALGLHGVAMVEFRFDPASGNHWLMEINMRFWGSLHLGAFAGADFPRALADMLLHDRVLPQPEVRLGVTARNVSRDVEWLKLVRKRRGNATRFELTRPLGKSLLEWGRVLTGRETWDGARLTDPAPLARELTHLARKEATTAAAKLTRALVLNRAPRLTGARRREFADAKRVLVLCHGNICRSPYVAARLAERTGSGREIRSAGFYPQADRPTPDDVQTVARRRGVDLSGHRSRLVSEADLAWADAIILMDHRNYVSLRAIGRNHLDKVLWLGVLDGAATEIEDPYGMSDAAIDLVLGRLDVCSSTLVG